MGVWIVAGNKDIIKLSNSAFEVLSSTIEELVQKSEKKYNNNLLQLVERMNRCGTLLIDLDRYFANSYEDINDFIHLVKLAIEEFQSNPYWTEVNNKKYVQEMIDNLEAYYDKVLCQSKSKNSVF